MDGPWDQYAAADAGPWDQYKPATKDAAPQVGIGEDLAKSAASAPGRVVASALGLPGDLYHLGLRALGDNLTPESAYGSHAIQKALGSDYEAQRLPGQLLQKTADFAPAMIGGPEGLAAKAATRVAAPVIASEIGKEVAGPYGELAGGLIGAGGATAAARKFQELGAARGAVKAVPTAEELLKTGSGQFDQARDMNLVVKPDFVQNTAADMRAAVKGFDPEGQKPVFSAIDRLEKLGSSAPGLPPTAVEMNEVELVRKQLSNLRMSSDAPTREAAREAMKTLTRNQQALTAADVVAGDASAYSKLMGDAVGNYGAGKRSNTVMGKAALGDLNAATAGSGANEDNALRQAIKQLVRPVNNDIVPKAQRLGFNQPEIDAMNQVARGTTTGNVARYVGKLAPTGSVSGVLSAGAGYGAAGPAGAIGLPVAGYLAKKIGDLSTKRAVAALDSLVRSRSPLAQQVAAQLPPQVVAQLPAKTQRILQASTVGAPPLRQQISQPVGQPIAQ